VSIAITKCGVSVRPKLQNACVEFVLCLLYPSGMADLTEQRICIKFCFKREKPAAETYKMLKRPFPGAAMRMVLMFQN